MTKGLSLDNESQCCSEEDAFFPRHQMWPPQTRRLHFCDLCYHLRKKNGKELGNGREGIEKEKGVGYADKPIYLSPQLLNRLPKPKINTGSVLVSLQPPPFSPLIKPVGSESQLYYKKKLKNHFLYLKFNSFFKFLLKSRANYNNIF